MPLSLIKSLSSDAPPSIDHRGDRWGLLLCLALILSLTSGCEELSKISEGYLNEDCEADAEALNQALESEGILTLCFLSKM